MTREEVVKWLESLKMEIGKAENRTLWHYAESIDMAIKALKAKTDGDLIGRSDAIDACCRGWNNTAEDCIRNIKALPSAEAVYLDDAMEIRNMILVKEYFRGRRDAEAVQDKWIFNPTDAIDLMFAKPKCSKCGFESSDGGNFCPNCGVRMTKGGEE